MKKLFLLLMICSYFSNAQINLVNNPSFETLAFGNGTICPSGLHQIQYSMGWTAVRQTPDYYNTCATSSIVGVPSSQAGYQLPASGNAYGGFFAYPLGNSSEYFGSKLNQSLTIGIKYYLSMKVNIAENWTDTANSFWDSQTSNLYPVYLPCNGMGMKFATKSHTTNSATNLMNNQAHLYSQAIVNDTTSWTTIQGSFIADSSYTNIIIGQFLDYSHTSFQYRPKSSYAYIFVDDIIVSTDSTIIDYTLGMAESSYNNKLLLYPNPAKDKLNLVFESRQALQKNEALFYNLLGELIYEKPLTEPNTEIDISFLKRGLYYVKVQNSVAKVLVE